MTSEAIATAEACFEAFGTRGLERTLSHFAPDATWTIPGGPALTPWAGHGTGPIRLARAARSALRVPIHRREIPPPSPDPGRLENHR